MVHIKKILIKGFKSYKEQTVFENFHPRSNVIVGRNGSGKSNFFDAVRFVLCDERFSSLRTPHERQGLLHVGAGDTVMSAYVEVHLDNSDGRFPTDKETVVLRRAIGLKKDEYFLDSRHLSKGEVTSFLESAGFSRSNPYYIVQQGRIAALATMRDEERFELLREVAGTRVYDGRREESTKLMTETAGKIEKADEVLGYIAQRLAELEGEQTELAEYEQLDRRRRRLEHSLYAREIVECDQRLADLDAERAAANETSTGLHARVEAAHGQAKEAERSLKVASAAIAAGTTARERAEEERQEAIRKRARLELQARDAEEKRARDKERGTKLAEELEEAEQQVAEATRKLEKETSPAWAAKVKEEAEARAALERAETRAAELYAKQGRSAQFSTKEERDKWLRRELKAVSEAVEQKKAQLMALRKEAEAMRESATREKEQADAMQAGMGSRREQIEHGQRSVAELRARRDELMGQKREQQRKAFDIDARAENVRREMQRCEKALESTMSRVLSQGLAALKRLVQEKGIRGVYGTLIENLEVDPALFTAVEVTAGSALFHVIVDTDETATVLLTELNKLGVGRVTCMPLNRLADTVPRQELPTVEQRAEPLLKCLKFDERFRASFAHVFGKTLLCRTQDVARELSRSNNCNCVTLDGDQVNRKGVWTGGFYDPRASRLDAMKGLRQCRTQAQSVAEEGRKAKQTVLELEQRVVQVLGELQKKETLFQQARDTYERLVGDLAQLSKEASSHSDLAEQRERSATQLAAALVQLEQTKQGMSDEMGTELLSQLSRDEQAELQSLLKEKAQLSSSVVNLAGERAQLESRKAALQNALESNLQKRVEDIRERQAQLIVSDVAEGTELPLTRELAEAEKLVSELSQRARDAEQMCEEAQVQLRDVHEQAENLAAQERSAQAEAAEAARELERIMNRRASALQKREEAAKKLQGLGSLPAPAEGEEDSPAQDYNAKDLMKELHAITEKLQAYSHVNKKAHDQYVSFTEQQASLRKRRQELDEGKESITSLIAQLDQKKDEAIERTFKGVSKNFSEVFTELVPEGSASLIMRRRTAEETEGSDEQQPPADAGSIVRQFSGVSVRVKFPGASEARMMHQLSGGQKSLVALALIFAIQRTDPAPFYLFDEVDSNLDTTYREAVARLVRKQSKEAQFIVTTFRPELVEHARKWYGITYASKVSTIGPITKQEAMVIIREDPVNAAQLDTQGQHSADEDEEAEAVDTAKDGAGEKAPAVKEPTEDPAREQAEGGEEEEQSGEEQ